MTSEILLVDDDADIRASISEALMSEGYAVRAAADAAEAIGEVSRDLPALMLCDVRMPGDDGISLLRRLRRDWPAV